MSSKIKVAGDKTAAHL